MPNLTVLLTASTKLAAKQFHTSDDGSTQKRNYDAGFRFMVEQHQIENIYHLSELLQRLEYDPRRFIIRGTPHAESDLQRPVLRRMHRESQPDFNQHPFVDEPLPWVMIDIDKLPTPEGMNVIDSPFDAAQHAINLLPEEFHDTSYFWQLSASAGISDSTALSIHLWFWLDTPTTSMGLREWAKKVNLTTGQKIIDPALYNPVQPHYTAAPLFSDELEDPLSQRSDFVQCTNDSLSLVVDIEVPEELQSEAIKARTGTSQTFRSGVHGFENILNEMGDHQDGDGFYNPLLRATASYVATRGIEETEAQREELKAYLRERIDEAVQSTTRDRSSINQYQSDQFLDGCINGAIEKFGASIPPVPPYFDTTPLILEEAEEKLKECIMNFTEEVFYYWQLKRREVDVDPETWHLKSAPTLAIKAAAGIGKTTKMISDSIASGAFEAAGIEFYVPSHILSEELEVKLKEELDTDLSECGVHDYSRVQVVKGRDNHDSDGVVLCQKFSQVRQVVALGLSVQKTLCDDGEHRCEFYMTCGYQKQFTPQLPLPEEITDEIEMGPGVVVMAHNHLFLHTRDQFPDPMMVVVDEAFYQSGIQTTTFPIFELRSERAPIPTVIFNAIYDGEPLLLTLRREHVTPNQLYQMANEIQAAQTVNISPVLSQAIQEQRLSETVRPSKLIQLYRAIGDELVITDRDKSHCISFNEGRSEVTIKQRMGLTIPSHVPMIFIDADLNKNILHQFKPDTPITKIPVERQAEVIQFSDLTFSKYALIHQEDNPLLTQVKEFIADISQPDKQTLVVSTLSVRRAITGETLETQQRVGEYEGASVVHFGILRGLDAFKEYDNVIIIGREQPSVAAMEGVTGGLWWDSEESIQFQQANESEGISLTNEVRGYRMRGGKPESVRTQVHPDQRVQMVLEQIRESESAQAIDRLRLVRPNQQGNQRRVFVLSNVPLDVTVDHLLGWKRYQQIKAVWEACNGVMPTKPEHLLIAAADVMGSLGTAKRYAREQKRIMFLIEYIIRDMSILLIKYRPASSSGKYSTAYISSSVAVEDYHQRLEEFVRSEVEILQG